MRTVRYVKLDDKGRLIMPVECRKNYDEGAIVFVHDDGSVTINPAKYKKEIMVRVSFNCDFDMMYEAACDHKIFMMRIDCCTAILKGKYEDIMNFCEGYFGWDQKHTLAHICHSE